VEQPGSERPSPRHIAVFVTGEINLKALVEALAEKAPDGHVQVFALFNKERHTSEFVGRIRLLYLVLLPVTGAFIVVLRFNVLSLSTKHERVGRQFGIPRSRLQASCSWGVKVDLDTTTIHDTFETVAEGKGRVHEHRHHQAGFDGAGEKILQPVGRWTHSSRSSPPQPRTIF